MRDPNHQTQKDEEEAEFSHYETISGLPVPGLDSLRAISPGGQIRPTALPKGRPLGFHKRQPAISMTANARMDINALATRGHGLQARLTASNLTRRHGVSPSVSSSSQQSLPQSTVATPSSHEDTTTSLPQPQQDHRRKLPSLQPPLLRDFLSKCTLALPSTLSDIDADTICPLCQEPYMVQPEPQTRPEVPVKLPCGHVFGSGCVTRWMSPFADGRNSCPMCRRGVLEAGFYPARSQSGSRVGRNDGGSDRGVRDGGRIVSDDGDGDGRVGGRGRGDTTGLEREAVERGDGGDTVREYNEDGGHWMAQCTEGVLAWRWVDDGTIISYF